MLKGIPTISSIEKLALTRRVLDAIESTNRKRAKKNSKHVFAYRIVYHSHGHKVVGFIVEPRGRQSTLPCIIWNRGGSKNFGSIRHGHIFGGIGDLASLGYIVIASQYSGNDGSDGTDQMGGDDIHDVLTLYKILSQYKRADIKRVGMYGWSRGGMMTYLSLSKVNWIKAAVVGGAPTDQVRARKFRT